MAANSNLYTVCVARTASHAHSQQVGTEVIGDWQFYDWSPSIVYAYYCVKFFCRTLLLWISSIQFIIDCSFVILPINSIYFNYETCTSSHSFTWRLKFALRLRPEQKFPKHKLAAWDKPSLSDLGKSCIPCKIIRKNLILSFLINGQCEQKMDFIRASLESINREN